MTTNQTFTASEVHAALAVWEEMCDRRRMGDEMEWAAPMHELWDSTGASEMRDLAAAIGKRVEAAWCSLSEDQHDSCGAFDWEFVPAIIRRLDWENGNPDDFDPAAMAMAVVDAVTNKEAGE